MGSSILSEGCQHLDSQGGAPQCYYYPLNRLPASRLLLPRSGLERSDFVRWHVCDMPGRSDDVCSWGGYCCKSLFISPITNFPGRRGSDRILMWGTTSFCDE